MKNYTIDSQFLFNLIEKHFSKMKCPDRLHIGNGPSSEFELENILMLCPKFSCWTKIPPELIRQHQSSLPFFSNEAYPFFLAAYMALAINEVQGYDNDQTLLMYLIYDLTYTNDETHNVYCYKRLSCLTTNQKQTVKKFLEFVKKHTNSDEFFSLIDKTLKYGVYE